MSFLFTAFPTMIKKSGGHTTVAVPVSFADGFEFADGWDQTVASVPSPTFAVATFNDGFEFSDGWDETVASIPSPTFASSNFDETFDTGWDGV